MCTVTTDSHVFLEVHPEARPEIAARLLAAAEAAGVCQQNPCHLTTTSEGFRVSAEVFTASGLAEDHKAPVDLDRKATERDHLAADVLDAEVPAATAPAAEVAPAPPKRKRNN